MLRATYFTYDGVYSGDYGLKIATLNSEPLNETTYIEPSIVTSIPAKAKKFFYQDIKYEAPPTYEFSILRDEPMPDVMQREILTWLDARRGFKELIIHQPEFADYTYKCIFTVVSIIYHMGQCVGFNLRAMFDSIYHYGKATTTKKIYGDGTVKTIEVYNNSDVIDEYVYPLVVFKTENYFDNGEVDEDGNKLNNCNILIYNDSDDEDREFKFNGVALKSEISINNELKIITCENDAGLLSKFNKKWLRLKKGKNILRVQFSGELEIICPLYVKIRF